MQKDSRAPPPNWPWSYRVEWRLMRLEEKAFKETTDQGDERQAWTPRDYLAAAAGIVMVIGALSQKVGWLDLSLLLAKLYGVR
jgi:hypothetical protein